MFSLRKSKYFADIQQKIWKYNKLFLFLMHFVFIQIVFKNTIRLTISMQKRIENFITYLCFCFSFIFIWKTQLRNTADICYTNFFPFDLFRLRFCATPLLSLHSNNAFIYRFTAKMLNKLLLFFIQFLRYNTWNTFIIMKWFFRFLYISNSLFRFA